MYNELKKNLLFFGVAKKINLFYNKNCLLFNANSKLTEILSSKKCDVRKGGFERVMKWSFT